MERCPSRLFTFALASLVGAAASVGLPGCREAAAPPPNLLLLTLDTTRVDALSAYDPRNARTPALDALAGESVVFKQAVTSAPYTGPSHASILTGLYPPQHGLRDFLNQAMSPEVESLPEILSGEGYRTAAFLSSYVLDARYGLDQGFDVYACDFGEAKGPAAELVPLLQRSAAEIVDDGLAWIDADPTGGRPFFLWLHFYDAHGPREPPDAFRRPPPAGRELTKLETVRRLYYDEVTYLDSEIGRLLDQLMERGLFGDLVVAVVSDHGELLGEYGRTFGAHSNSLYDATLHVPMLLRIPRDWRAAVVREQVRTIDLFPTLLEALSLAPPQPSLARSLYPLVEGGVEEARSAYSETFYALPERAAEGDQLMSLRRGRWKLIAGPKRESLYDLRRDPAERNDLAATERDKVAELREVLRLLGAEFPKGEVGRALEMSDDEMREHREKLRALGYLE